MAFSQATATPITARNGWWEEGSHERGESDGRDNVESGGAGTRVAQAGEPEGATGGGLERCAGAHLVEGQHPAPPWSLSCHRLSLSTCQALTRGSGEEEEEEEE